MRHFLVCLSDSPRPVFVYSRVIRLASEYDSVFSGVLFGDIDEIGVWPCRAFDNWRTRKRRNVSYRWPSSSDSGCIWFDC